MAHWEADFDFYMAQMDDKPASFVIDLAAAAQAPVPGHGLLLSIRVPMLRPRPDGLRDASELDDLGALEDQFVDALAEKVDAIYVGRTVHDGQTTLYLYAPEVHRDALEDLPALTGAPPGDYEPSWSVDDDPDWEQYTGFLTPDPYAHQSIWNRRLINQFTEMNDQLDAAREIDHLAYFPARAAAEQGATALAAAGFRVEAPTDGADEADDDETDDDERWALQFHRDDVLAGDRPDEFVAEILDVILPLGGRYDGWGAAHRKAE